MGRKAAPPPPPAPAETDPAAPTPLPKKKGRPSLLDLQRRALILQQQQQQEEDDQKQKQAANSAAPLRRSTRRNPLPPSSPSSSSSSGGRRREKKLKLVLENGADRGPEGPGGGEKRTERPNSSSLAKVMGGGAQGNPSDSGPTTPLPDKKTLLLILERLQKKDRYGVYSEPVDPEELPDYHEIIEHPMDFGTVKKKLSDGAYANLEQFEKDVFLISSNAMRYNAPDTVYFRQARSIEELAKKSFENLRQGNEENEQEPEVRVVRRGRPPGKNTAKKPVGRPPTEPSILQSPPTDATPPAVTSSASFLGSSNELLRKAPMSNIFGFMSPNQAPQVLFSSENRFPWNDNGNRFGRSEESSGLMQKMQAMKFAKKSLVPDDNRRSTYLHPLPSNSGVENPILSTFTGERKQLLPIGVFLEHAYARSLARFAANLGPVGWDIAAKRIEKSLPPGTPFGRGWVGENDLSHVDQHQTHNDSSASPANPAASATEARSKTADHQPDPSPSCTPLNNSGGGNDGNNLHGKAIAELKDGAPTHQHLQVQHLQKNGFNSYYFNLPHVANVPLQASAGRELQQEVPMTHGQLLDMVSRTNNVELSPAAVTQLEVERMRSGNTNCASNSSHPVYLSPDARLSTMSSPGMLTSGVGSSHSAMRTELDRVNFSNVGFANSACNSAHPSVMANPSVISSMVMGNSDSRMFVNPGMMGHGFVLGHSAMGNHSTAEPSIPADSRPTASLGLDGDLALQNLEKDDERLMNAGDDLHATKQHIEKENPSNSSMQHFSNALSESAQPVAHHPKVDSICPDLNSVFQGTGSQFRSAVSQKSDLALQL